MKKFKGFYTKKFMGGEWQVDTRISEEFLNMQMSPTRQVYGFGEDVMQNVIWTPRQDEEEKNAISINFRPLKQSGALLKENKLFKAVIPPGYNMLYPTNLVILTSDIDETSRIRAFAFTHPHPRASFLVKAEPILSLEEMKLPDIASQYPYRHSQKNPAALADFSTHDQVEVVGALHFLDMTGSATYLMQADLEGYPRAWERATGMHLVMEKNKAFIPVVENSSNKLGYLIKPQVGLKGQIQMTPQIPTGLPNDHVSILVKFLRENLITQIAKSL